MKLVEFFWSSHAQVWCGTLLLCAIRLWKVQKSRSFRRSHQFLWSCGGIVSEQGLGRAWGAHTASAPWDRAWIGSGAALELWHLIKMRIINLQLMVMVAKMCSLRAGTTHPLLLLGEWNEDFYVGRKKPQAPNVTVSELSLCVTKTWQFQLSDLGEVDGLCANEERISWSAVWRGRGIAQTMKTKLIYVIILHFE